MRLHKDHDGDPVRGISDEPCGCDDPADDDLDDCRCECLCHQWSRCDGNDD